MKKLLYALSVLFVSWGLHADITFGAEDAELILGDATQIQYHPSDDSVRITGGTLSLTDSVSLSGSDFKVTSTLLNQGDSTYARITNATLATTETGYTIELTGGGELRGFNGFRIDNNLLFSGSTNYLTGDINFVSPFEFQYAVAPYIGLTMPLNNNLVLDGNMLFLENDLVCKSDVQLLGAGAVTGNGYSFVFGQSYHNAISGAMSWVDVEDIKLRGNITLTSPWFFYGNCCVDGGDCTIDLRSGGHLYFTENAQITFRNVVLKGVNEGSFVFVPPSSEGAVAPVVILDGVRLHTSNSITMTVGEIQVTGDSTLVLGDHNWTFSDDAKLTVDSALLSLNVLSNEAEPATGTICAPDPIYVEHVKNAENVAAGIVAGNLAFESGGVISEISQVLIPGVGGGGGDSGDIVLDATNVLSPSDVVSFDADATIDGNGSSLVFANPGTPQFTVAAGKTVRLSNIELKNVRNTTFSLGAGAIVEIGESVVFDISDDIVWSSEQLKMVDSGNIFEIRSTGPTYSWTFASAGIGEPHELTYATHLDLGTNTVLLRNIIFSGLRHVAYDSVTTEGVTTVGEILLGGNATLEAAEIVISHHIAISGLGNNLRLYSDTVTFSDGSLTFEASGVNAVTFACVMPEDGYGAPTFHFWDEFLNISSASGTASCIFDIPEVTIRNRAADAFLLGVNGFLKGQLVTISDNPIVQTSARAWVVPGSNVQSTLSSGALVLDSDLLFSMRGKSRRVVRSGRKAKALEAAARAVSLPVEGVVPIVNFSTALALPELAGNIKLKELYGLSYTNLRISAEQALNLTLYDGVRVEQAAVALAVKEDDIINVVGGSLEHPNRIVLQGDCYVAGSLMLADDAVLLIEGASPALRTACLFAGTSTISYGARSRIIFKNVERVELPDDWAMDFEESEALFVIGEGTCLQLVEGQTVTLAGQGTLQCQDGGRFLVESGSQCHIGSSHTDELTVRAKQGGLIQLGSIYSDEAPLSYLSFVRGSNVLDCSRGGSLVVTKRGVCECNALNGETTTSNMIAIDFSLGGLLHVASGGLFACASNASGDGISAYFSGALVNGSGLVGLVGSSFCGKLQPNSVSGSGLTAAAFVSQCVQTKDTLVASTVYFDAQSLPVLRTKNGVLVSLSTNQIITADTEAGVVSGYNVLTGRRFSYDANGVLR